MMLECTSYCGPCSVGKVVLMFTIVFVFVCMYVFIWER